MYHATASVGKCGCSKERPVETPSLGFCDVYIRPKDAVGCGDVGVLEMDQFKGDTSVCSVAPTYELLGADEFFQTATLSPEGVFTWVPSFDSSYIGQAVFRVSCGVYSNIVNVSVGRKNKCEGITCPRGSRCNQCSGDCEGTTDVDIFVIEADSRIDKFSTTSPSFVVEVSGQKMIL